MSIHSSRLEGILLIEPKLFKDERGFFMEAYNKRLFHLHGITEDFVQDNHSLSKQIGTLRGLHYQLPPKAQAKLIRVTKGAIYDVVVDLRQDSPTFGKWEGFMLSAENKKQLFIPKGFAHGFCTLMKDTEVQYKVDEFYSPEHDRGIRWNDPHLAIDWPVSVPFLSSKDAAHPFFTEAEL
ncbi:dTDP-4-dehydrorhamnose 3,5-epimerase [Metabacillus iocasae]|uniref:dTDP-4-dehydrorhamnose 3,5-epimerase n=1 Tax=Priestia iocasae TaxID=2291674 RepID=A0ABS2QWW8_9BACI|nr:dTDP-4-dehydrorhamnose 3,5-epimerase [Metabacillus iocasae]MBM7703910.1 dTDP-4-dehydrorhamnose 3,5-epimerase [Metabacillus iocasae]